MPRPRLELGTWGKITRTEVTPAHWRARARFRDFTGKTRQVEAWGTSGAAAQRALERDLRDRAQSAGEHITREMRISTLGRAWLAEMEQSELKPQSLAEYRSAFTQRIEPALGEYAIREATISVLDRFLKSVAAKRPALGKQCKVVLNGMFGLAARHDAITHNPVRETKLPARQRQAVVALSLDEVQALRRGVHAWQTEPGTHGPKRAPDLLDLVDVLLGTGLRIGEVCALRWDDVDLGAEHPSIVVSGTVVRVKGKGLTRQAHPKTSSGFRRLILPAFVVETLFRRQVEAQPNPWNVVFPSAAGTLRDPHNVRRQWRDARTAAGFEWVSPHTFRKTVATLVDRSKDTESAAALLGHSGTAVTHAHYVQKMHEAPDLSNVLSQLGANRPGVIEKGG